MATFLERFVLTVLAAILVTILLVNPKNYFNLAQQISGVIGLFGFAAFLGITIERMRNQPLASEIEANLKNSSANQSADPAVQQIHYGIGDNIAGNKITYERKLFSETQKISLLPTAHGGNDTLNLDNVGFLSRFVPYDNFGITMLLNVVPLGHPDKDDGEVKIADLQVYDHSKAQPFVFDTREHKSHDIRLAGRVFHVTLKKVKVDPREYEFGISELDSSVTPADGQGGKGRGGTINSSSSEGGSGGKAEATEDGIAIGGRGGSGGELGGGKGGSGGAAFASGRGKAMGGEGGPGGRGLGGGPGGPGGDTSTNDSGLTLGGDGGAGWRGDGRGGDGAPSPLRKAYDLMQPEERKIFYPNGRPPKWGPGAGGRGANSREYDRRVTVLVSLSQEFKKNHPDQKVTPMLGVDLPPKDWVNSRLKEMGESFFVEVIDNGEDFFLHDAKPKK